MIQNNQIYNGTAVGAMIYRDPEAEQQSFTPQYYAQPGAQASAQYGQPSNGQPYNPFAPQNNRQPNLQFNPYFNPNGPGNQAGPNGLTKKKIIIGSVAAAAIAILFGVAIAFAHKNTRSHAEADNPSDIRTAEADTEEEAEESRYSEYSSSKKEIKFAGEPVHVDGLSDDYLSEQFAMNGKVYHLPFAYSEISDQYTFDLSDNSFVESETLNPDEQTSCVVHMEGSNLDDGIFFATGFENTTSSAKDIKESDIWAFDIDVSWVNSENYPEIVLPKGITWGCTLDDIVAAYGEPSHSYRSDINGYWEYTYDDGEYDYSMRLTVYDGRGMTRVALHSFKAD